MIDQLQSFHHWNFILIPLMLLMLIVGRIPESAIGEYQHVTIMTILLALIMFILIIS